MINGNTNCTIRRFFSRKHFLGFIALLFAALPASAQSEQTSPRLHFKREVVSVLTKAGCNAGACHGSFQGRGGLRLSLLGFDPQTDYEALALEARGRRVLPSAPEHSLILRKATGAMAHGGGKRIDPKSESYRILREWMKHGMPGPKSSDPQLVNLHVTQPDAVIAKGDSLQLNVQTLWSDDVKQNATRWAHFESTNDSVAKVSKDGTITVRGPGRCTIMVRFHEQMAAVAVTVPYGPTASKNHPQINFIDDFIIAEWNKVGVEPAPLANDAEFLRRVYLDLIGTLPTPKEIRAFLDSPDTKKRTKIIDALLDRPEYVTYWRLKWADLLRAHRRALGDKGLRSFDAWLQQALRENRSIDRITRELLTAKGNLYKNGPVAFYFVDQKPHELAETTAQIFLGVRLQCAKCHHHPFEVWSQEDYYGMAAFFTGVERKDTKEDGRYGGAQSIRVTAKGVMRHPKTKEIVAPTLLGGTAIDANKASDPRQALAEWITDKNNPYFARNIVNRYWSYLFGRGLVHPLDDLRATNPASHPALLTALADEFVRNGFDLKHLLRTICNSRTYQLASEINPKRDQNGALFTHHRPRQLPAEVLLDAINQASATTEDFNQRRGNRAALVPLGTRAIALPDPTVASFFLDTFGRPKRTSTCECERTSAPDLSQALHLANSITMHRKVSHKKGRVANLLTAKKNDDDNVEELYLATLCRLPTGAERATIRRLLAEAPTRQVGFEDLLWTLLNCSEFVCNH